MIMRHAATRGGCLPNRDFVSFGDFRGLRARLV
jgi:hypothetical protein